MDDHRQEVLNDSKPVSFKVLRDTIYSTNFKIKDEVNKLVGMMERDVKPWIVVGSSEGVYYRLIPGAYNLKPDKDSYPPGEEVRYIDILGINTNVSPPIANRREQNVSTESADSNDSDVQENGFVFHQLGRLEYLDDYINNFKPNDWDQLGKADWEPTGFCVEVEILANGFGSSIYAIYDMHPRTEWGERREITDPTSWRRLRGHNQQISCAKMADSILQLGMQHRIPFSDKCNQRPELVRASQVQGGAIRRVTIQQAREWG